MIDKAPDAYRTISEVADELDLPQHVLRFWETRFGQIKPLKRGGGRRYYRPDDVELLKGIRHLLYAEGYTIKGVQRILKEQGPKAVQAFVPPAPAVEAHEPVAPSPPPAPRPVTPPHLPPIVPTPVHVAPHVPAQVPVAPVYAEPQLAEPVMPPLAPAFPPERPYTVPPALTQPVGTPVYMPEPDLFVVDDASASLNLPEAGTVIPAAPTVSYMRGGLSKPPPAPVEVPVAAQPTQTFSVRRTIKPTLPEPVTPRYSPLVEPDLGDQRTVDAQPAPRAGLSDDTRRALQAALFELSECRRSIENVIAARGR